ncbi:unnamed protein product [Rotaria sp. Silwood1]|nr:unnamed protein product [Rotaria sp. Silwood1]CAF0772282.1 unnamed protein product [Rotaria sp. Silwood1]CAF3322142.1 unnamed protein product [Rotaria sp. Silwood1]CAF3339655.1 unnamed protein product [Rotaria sp. Silwood1]CAF3347734.1 unnamed protein product [Rotaria sp. Silwood1]
MLFLISFAWLVAASFAFVLAILTPNWLSFIPSEEPESITVERGIFYICNSSQIGNGYKITQCLSIIEQKSSSNRNTWLYELAIACAVLAIACAGLSIIVLWLSGIYFQVRRRTKDTLCFLFCIILLTLIIFCSSFVVWILLIAETLKLGISIDRHRFSWPMWLAVGATGGYLMSLLTMIFSFCAIYKRKNKINQNYYRPRNQF